MNGNEEISPSESRARQVALQLAVKIATSEMAIKTSVHTGIVDQARSFYDFLRGDVETTFSEESAE